MWRVFVKAGKPGWAAVIPFYNTYVLLKIGGHPGWWLILCFIPIINFIILFVIASSVAKMFGRSMFFGIIMLGLVSFIGYPILAFGKSKYVGKNNQTNQPPLYSTEFSSLRCNIVYQFYHKSNSYQALRIL